MSLKVPVLTPRASDETLIEDELQMLWEEAIEDYSRVTGDRVADLVARFPRNRGSPTPDIVSDMLSSWDDTNLVSTSTSSKISSEIRQRATKALTYVAQVWGVIDSLADLTKNIVSYIYIQSLI